MTLSVMTRENRWGALALLLTAVFMDMVDNQIVTIALPTIQRDLGVSPSALQWTATGYTLAFALTLITGGRLGDRFGHRATFALGTAGFGVASLTAGLAPNVTVLLAARVGQGVFAGLMVPQVLSFIHAEFSGAEQRRAMGFFGMTFPIGGIAGPLLGGLLTQADLFGWHWRTIFFVNVPIALAAPSARCSSCRYAAGRSRWRRRVRCAGAGGRAARGALPAGAGSRAGLAGLGVRADGRGRADCSCCSAGLGAAQDHATDPARPVPQPCGVGRSAGDADLLLRDGRVLRAGPVPAGRAGLLTGEDGPDHAAGDGRHRGRQRSRHAARTEAGSPAAHARPRVVAGRDARWSSSWPVRA